MQALDTRRLTGLNVFWDRPGSVVDISASSEEIARLLALWPPLARRMLDALGWSAEEVYTRVYDYGVSLVISAPIDALYAACEVNDWIVAACANNLEQPLESQFAEARDRLAALIAEEERPALLSLRDAAEARGLSFLSDDEQVSIGLGRGSRTWPIDEVPAPDVVPWQALHNIPIALITGTNGKTTTSRMAAAIVATAGRRVGICSTDSIAIGGDIIDRGDYAGPGGARTIARHPEVDTAILETARGGLLRRGLGLGGADAVVITTIAEDHLGDFGSRSVNELLDIKWVTTRALRGRGHLVLNADDSLLVERASQASAPITWFTLDDRNAVVLAHIEAGGRAALVREGELVLVDAHHEQRLCRITEIPLTVGGAARHNVSNALAAAALTWGLGISPALIAEGLRSTSTHDNPGRGNLFEIEGRQILVDFAHNPQAMQALFEFARALPARRRLLSFGQAGDRPDDDIRALAHKVWAIGLERVHIVELPKYKRGREDGEVCALLRSALSEAGAAEDCIGYYDSELASLQAAIDWSQPGDLILLMALASSKEIVTRLQGLSNLQGLATEPG